MNVHDLRQRLLEFDDDLEVKLSTDNGTFERITNVSTMYGLPEPILGSEQDEEFDTKVFLAYENSEEAKRDEINSRNRRIARIARDLHDGGITLEEITAEFNRDWSV